MISSIHECTVAADGVEAKLQTLHSKTAPHTSDSETEHRNYFDGVSRSDEEEILPNQQRPSLLASRCAVHPAPVIRPSPIRSTQSSSSAAAASQQVSSETKNKTDKKEENIVRHVDPVQAKPIAAVRRATKVNNDRDDAKPRIRIAAKKPPPQTTTTSNSHPIAKSAYCKNNNKNDDLVSSVRDEKDNEQQDLCSSDSVKENNEKDAAAVDKEKRKKNNAAHYHKTTSDTVEMDSNEKCEEDDDEDEEDEDNVEEDNNNNARPRRPLLSVEERIQAMEAEREARLAKVRARLAAERADTVAPRPHTLTRPRRRHLLAIEERRNERVTRLVIAQSPLGETPTATLSESAASSAVSSTVSFGSLSAPTPAAMDAEWAIEKDE